jgi:uncharacterized protein YhaN
MKIQMINLAAYGPFTDKSLIFDQATSGLHIIYGPNEAGKSSALRGLKALLYGIEVHTPDNFLHANNKLRIHGCLCTADGREFAFTRRKGSKNTLLNPEGGVLDEQTLRPFLQGVTEELFNTLFGIDHQALLQGGQEILEQKGEVGQVLFSAALGSHVLHAVLEQFDDEADGLFRPRGSTQVINAALKSYTELKKEIREHSLSSREWDEHHRSFKQTGKELAQVQSELAGNRSEFNRLKRIQRILPKLARRRELLGEFESLGEVVILADDFPDRHQQAVKGLETAQAIIGKAAPRLNGLQKQLQGLSINQELLDQAENIEDLHARLGSHRKALQDHPHLIAECQQFLTDAEFLLKNVRPDLELKNIEKLRPVLSRRQAITELGNKKTLLISHAKQAESGQRETETQLKGARKDLQELQDLQQVLVSGSSDVLRRTISAARKLGDIDAAIQSARSELASLQLQCTADLSRLTLWDGIFKDLPGLEVPNRENLNRFEEAYAELEKRFRLLLEKQEEITEALQGTSLTLDEIKRAGDVPTEMELVEVRSDRDQIWQLLRRQWVDGEALSAEASRLNAKATLPDTFEERMVDADKLSDRLRREADRVHAMASLQAREEAMQRQMAEIARKLESCTGEKNQLDTEWQALWAAGQILPQTPREMQIWLGDLERLRDQVVQLNKLCQKADELEQSRKTHIQLLNQQLEMFGKGSSKSSVLETVLIECEEAVQQFDIIKQKRDSLDKEIKVLETDLASLTHEHQLATEELEAWNTQWRELIESFGLQGNVFPSEMSDVIEKLRELFVKQHDAEKLQIRINAMDADAVSFRKQVAIMLANIVPELVDLTADDAVMRLNSLLSDNRSRQTQCQQIEKQLEQAQQEIQDSRATIKTMTSRLDTLCTEAKCDSHADLEEAERKSARHFKIKAAIDSIEQEIIETGEGASITSLEAEAKGIDPDILPGRIKALSHKIDDELEPKRTDLAQTKGRKEKELELMDGSDHAASLADQAQTILAGIRSNAERYVRIKLSGRVLRDEIERYRKENQGPLVKRASEHFAKLTLGSFKELMTDFNKKDEPVLTGIRPDGERVYVEGMSSGTRDQLYLALRLASLEKYMESAEPMPFIVDDVLVDFDDLRSEAALNALAVLAEKTQVILFTHHSQCVEQAKRLQSTAPVEVHEL